MDSSKIRIKRVGPVGRSRLWLGLIVLGAFGVSPVVTNGDSFLVAPTANSLVSEHNLDLNEFDGKALAGGIAYVTSNDKPNPGVVLGVNLPRPVPPTDEVFDYFPWTTALLAVPLVAVLRIPGSLLGIGFFNPHRMVAQGDTGLINLVGGSLLTAAMVVVAAAVAFAGLSLPDTRRRRVSILVGFVVAFGTSAWSTLSRALWSQSTSTLLVAIVMLAVVKLVMAERLDRNRGRWAVVAGVAAGLAYSARPTNAVIVVSVGLLLLLRHRDLILRYLLGGVAIAVPWIAVNLATWGTLQPPYFSTGRIGLGSSTLEAIAGNLISPSRGLLVFSPIALLGCAGFVLAMTSMSAQRRQLAALCLGVFAVHLVVVSGSGENWWAGASYGPRFMADMIPVVTVLALPAIERLAGPSVTRVQRGGVAILVALSVLMHLPGAWSKPALCWNLSPVRVDDHPSRVWAWSDPQALEPIRVLLHGGTPRDAVLRGCDSLLDADAQRVVGG